MQLLNTIIRVVRRLRSKHVIVTEAVVVVIIVVVACAVLARLALLVFRHGGRARASDLTWRHVDAVRQPHAPVYVQVMSVRVCLQQQEICAIRSVKASMALVHS